MHAASLPLPPPPTRSKAPVGFPPRTRSQELVAQLSRGGDERVAPEEEFEDVDGEEFTRHDLANLELMKSIQKTQEFMVKAMLEKEDPYNVPTGGS